MNKIGVFLGDLFWSSVPYDGLDLYLYLKSVGHDVDLIMFNSDIRLNKEFDGKESFYFDTSKFHNSNDLVLIKNWNDFLSLSTQYSLIITSAKIAPKTRFPKIPISKCPIAVWDIGGHDILTDAVRYAKYYFVKGVIWKEWLTKLGVPEEKIFVTGSPHYDNYLTADNDSELFFKKYSLDSSKKVLMIAPSNPPSHTKQYDKNVSLLTNIIDVCEENNYQIILKTYPHDYVFYESEKEYSGVYRRRRYSIPQYQHLKKQYGNIHVIESQDHFLAIRNSDLMFNMAGSSVAWDTYFTECNSFTSNFKNQPYYKRPSYLPEGVVLPNGFMNYDISSENVYDVFENYDLDKSRADSYFLKENSLKNISKAILEIL